MYYKVDIYGGGNPQEIVKNLRELADQLEKYQDADLTGDGFQTSALVMDLSEGEE